MTRPYDPERHCGATTRGTNPGPCTREHGWGTDHPGYGLCKLHGGASPGGRKQAATLQARSVVEALQLDTPPGVTPIEALERELARSAVLVDALRHRLVADLTGDTGDRALVWGVTSTRKTDGDDKYETVTVEQATTSVWWNLYREERVHLLKVAQALGGLVPADAALGDDTEAEALAARLLAPDGPLAKVVALHPRTA